MTDARYAVYWSPRPETALAAFGRNWLGRDAETGQHLDPLINRSLAAEGWCAVVGEPARYGFHATLKPPFRLAPEMTLAALEEATRSLAAMTASLAPFRLRLASLDGFLALIPMDPVPGMADLAARCVASLDPFRAAADADELARRRAAGLTPAQDALLQRWGYPFVMDEFRFHITLTRKLAPGARAVFEPVLAPLASRACAAPIEIADLCLFEQPEPRAPFNIRRRFRLGAIARVARSA